ncbi:MAG: prepilin-type N-terminal cleavage/methylation domain-containing protein [Chthoniobacterales bacterium]
MRRSDAFTLVELLVSLAITVVLVLLLASVVTATLGAWRQGRNRLDTFATARQVLGRLGDELKGARANPSVGASKIQFVENQPVGAVPPPIPAAAENIFFVAPYPNLGAGDLCSVAYALDTATHELKRAFRSSDQVWADGAARRFQFGGHTYVAADWHVVATAVLEFELRCYSQHDIEAKIEPPAASWDSEATDPNMTGSAPRRVLLRLRVIDDRAATQLAGLTAGSTAYDAIVNRSARQFFYDVSLLPP